MTNQEVLNLQRTLNNQGYRDKNGNRLAEDGLLGENTTYALQKMLNAKGFRDSSGNSLSTDGVWGPKTQAAYNRYRGTSGTATKTSTASSMGKSPLLADPAPAQPVSPYQTYLQKQQEKLYADITAKLTPIPSEPLARSSVMLNTQGSLSDAQQNTLTWQRLLNRQGFRDANGQVLAEDGIWGAKTQYAWEQYQKQQQQSAAPAGNTNYLQRRMQEEQQALLNKLATAANTHQNQAQAPVVTQRSWLEQRQNTDPISRKLAAAMKADPEAAAVFSDAGKILHQQIVLNTLGFTGINGQPLREDGELDLDTLVAWDKLRHGSGMFGNAGSPIMQVVNGKDEADLTAIVRGLVPSTTVIDPLQTKSTGVAYISDFKKDGVTKKYQLRDTKSNQRLFEIDKHNLPGKNGTIIKDAPHINVEAPKTATLTQKQLAKSLNEMRISEPLYSAFHNFDDVTKYVKKGGKALAVVGTAVDVYTLGSTIYADLNDADQKLGRDSAAAAAGIGGSWLGGFAGAKLGAMGGAALGTLICPGLGTAIGGFLGGLGGGAGGAYGGEQLGQWAIDQAYK